MRRLILTPLLTSGTIPRSVQFRMSLEVPGPQYLHRGYSAELRSISPVRTNAARTGDGVRPSLLSLVAYLALAGLLAGRGNDPSSNPAQGPTTPSVVATRDVAVVEDDRCYHLATRSGPSCGDRP